MLLPWLLPGFLRAQITSGQWRTYTEADGFAGNWVYDSVQTPDRALWFGADKGVFRFDGAWRHFGVDDGLPAGSVRALLVDADGAVWAGTDIGVARWQEEAWVQYGVDSGLPAAPIFALAQLSDGRLWAGGAAGLFEWQEARQGWTRVAGAPTSRAVALAPDATGGVWLADGNRLYHYQEEHWQEIPIVWQGKALAASVMALEPSRGQGVWIGTDGEGVFYYDGRLRRYTAADGLPKDKITSLYEEDEDTLWVGTNGGGVGRLKRGRWQTFTAVDGLASDFVTSVFADADGILWFGAAGGISRLDDKTWQDGQGDANAPRTPILSLAAAEDALLWAGSSEDGVFRFDGAAWERLPVFQNDAIESVFLDADGHLWVGTNGAGVAQQGEGQTRWFSTKQGLAGDVVLAIAQTPDRAMWFGTFGQGLSRWDGQTWQTFTTGQGLGSNQIQALFVDASGRLWAGTQGGVSVLENGVWRTYTTSDGLAANDIRGITQAADGSMWFATWGNGVSRLQDGAWTSFSTSDGLPAAGVEAIWAEKQGPRVWFGTAAGLGVYDGRTWQRYPLANGAVSQQIHALAPGPDGSIYLGTDAGVLRFRPDSTPPEVDIRALNNHPPGDAPFPLTPAQSLSIDLEGRDMLTPSSDLYYLYRLADYDAGWRGATDLPITYQPLPPGRYRLEVMARDASLNYSQPKAIEIEVSRNLASVWLPGVGQVGGGAAMLAIAGLAVIGAAFLLHRVWRHCALRQEQASSASALQSLHRWQPHPRDGYVLRSPRIAETDRVDLAPEQRAFAGRTPHWQDLAALSATRASATTSRPGLPLCPGHGGPGRDTRGRVLSPFDGGGGRDGRAGSRRPAWNRAIAVSYPPAR